MNKIFLSVLPLAPVGYVVTNRSKKVEAKSLKPVTRDVYLVHQAQPEQAQAAGKWLSELEIKPKEIIHFSSQPAGEVARIISDEIGQTSFFRRDQTSVQHLTH